MSTPTLTPQPRFSFPFVKGRRFSIEEADEEREHKVWWRRGCFACFAIIGGLIVIVAMLVNKHKEIPYMYQVDRATGTVVALGPIPPMGEPLDDTIRKQLREFVLCLRWIMEDVEGMRWWWNMTEFRLTKNGRKAFNAYREWFKPLQQRNPVKIEFLRPPLRRSARTWSVQWQETRFDRVRREVLDTHIYTGEFTFEVRPPQGIDERRDNPAGIFFDTWQFDKDK